MELRLDLACLSHSQTLLSFFTSRITNSRYFFNSIPSNSVWLGSNSVFVIRCFFSLVILVTAFCISISISARPIWPKSFDSKAYLYIDLRKSLKGCQSQHWEQLKYDFIALKIPCRYMGLFSSANAKACSGGNVYFLLLGSYSIYPLATWFANCYIYIDRLHF